MVSIGDLWVKGFFLQRFAPASRLRKLRRTSISIMKTLIACSLILTGSLALAEEVPALTFPNSKIGVPPLSLLEGAKQGLPPVFGDGPYHRAPEQPFTRARRSISRMPIVAPSSSVAVNMPIKTPDELVDYKMLVKAPDVESIE